MARWSLQTIAALLALAVLGGCSGQLGDALRLKRSLEGRLGVKEVSVGFQNGIQHLTIEVPDSAAGSMT